MKSLSILFSIVFLAAACNKVDETGPAITIVSPANNSIGHLGMSTQFQVDLTDETSIHHINFKAINVSEGDTFLALHFHPDATSFTIDTTVVLPGSDHSDFMIHVSADDHEGNSSTTMSHFHAHP